MPSTQRETLIARKTDLTGQRQAAHQRMTDAIAAARTEKRDLTPTESGQFDAARADVQRLDRELREVADLIEDHDEAERRSARVDQSRRDLGVAQQQTERAGTMPGYENQFRTGSEARTYRPHDSQVSWLKDAVNVALRGDQQARERMERNNAEARALTTTDGAGGDFVPPVWLVEQFVNLARAQRVTADLVQKQPLPAGTDSINIPRLATGTATAEQATQNSTVQNTDATTNAISAAVTTLAGGQTLSVQLIEQSPINMDQVILGDLLKDLAAKTDLFVISNNAVNKYGLLSVSGTNAVTAGTATVASLYSKIAGGANSVASGVFAAADAIVMHPRRWFWFLAQADSSGRPLIVPSGAGPYNEIGTMQPGGAPASGLVGEIGGIPVYVDPLIPTNLGAGTNEDRVLVLKRDSHVLFEGSPRAEVFRETKADSLSVYCRVYNYVAEATRYPAGVSILAGAGLVAPTF